MSIELNKTPFPGLLSTLIVDADKDWQGYDITSLGGLGIRVAAPLGARLHIDTDDAATVGIRVDVAAGQTANIFESYTSGGALQSFIDDDGSISIGTSAVSANRTLRLWGTAIISARHVSIGNAVTLIEKIEYVGGANAEGLRTNVVYFAKSGGDPSNRWVRGAHYHIDIRDLNRDLAGQYMAGFFEMEPTITNGNATTGRIYGFDFLYNDISHYGTAPIVSSLRFRETGLRRATAVLTELRYIDIAKTAYATTHLGTITNVIALDIGDIDKGATLNYAIRTQAGDIMLNEGAGQCDFTLKGANYTLIETDSSDDELWLGKNASAEISLFGVDPITQRAHVADADGTLASATAVINQVLANLEAIGLHATV